MTGSSSSGRSEVRSRSTARALGQPASGAEPHATVVGAEQHVAGHDRAVRRDPVDDLGAARRRDRLDAARQRIARPEGLRRRRPPRHGRLPARRREHARAVPRGDDVRASRVPEDRHENGHGLADARHERVEGSRPREERVDQHEVVAGPRRRPSRRPASTPDGASSSARAPAAARRRSMAAEPTLVGLDVGTTGVKAIAVSPDGAVLASATRGYPLSTPRPGWSEQDPEDWWEAAVGGARRGVRRTLGGGHRPLRPDARARRARRRRPRDPSRPSVERPADRRRVRRDRGARRPGAPDRADGEPGADRLHRAEAPLAAPARARRVLADRARDAAEGLRPAPAHGRVGDRRGGRVGDAALRRRAASLERRGAGRARAPARLVPAGARVAGRRRASPRSDGAAGRPGRGGRRRPARGGARGRDRPAGAGVRRPRHVRRRARRAPGLRARSGGPRPRVLPRRARHVAGDGRDAVGRRARSSGSTSGSHRTTSFDELVAEAAAWPPGAEGLLFAPYLAGERTPHADPDARGAFVGLQLRHDRGALVRAVLEGVAFGLRDALDAVRELGVDASVGRVSGGGARSPLWLEIVASVLDIPLERTESEEGSAFGAALLGGVAGGVFADASEAVARCVRVGERPVEPDPVLRRGVRRAARAVPRALPGAAAVRLRRRRRAPDASPTRGPGGDRALDNTVIRYFNSPTSTVRCRTRTRRPRQGGRTL